SPNASSAKAIVVLLQHRQQRDHRAGDLRHLADRAEHVAALVGYLRAGRRRAVGRRTQRRLADRQLLERIVARLLPPRDRRIHIGLLLVLLLRPGGRQRAGAGQPGGLPRGGALGDRPGLRQRGLHGGVPPLAADIRAEIAGLPRDVAGQFGRLHAEARAAERPGGGGAARQVVLRLVGTALQLRLRAGLDVAEVGIQQRLRRRRQIAAGDGPGGTADRVGG